MFDELRYVDTLEEGNQTRVLFESVNRPGGDPIDIDELSSGEKAVFSIFLPVIEEEFRRQMGEPRRELTLIVDEVENHLHPSLQLRALGFMRKKSVEGFQFICTTHSTTLIKASAQEELYHVLPLGMTVGNQLRRAARETHALVEVMQESVLFASGFQRHIFCEGYDPPKVDESNICDSELYSSLLDTTQHHRIVASGSCDALIAGAKAVCSTVFAPLCIAAIRDKDQGRTPDPTASWCDIVLPAYSLESILLDPEAIHDIVARYGITLAQIREAIQRVLLKLSNDQEAQLITPGVAVHGGRDWRPGSSAVISAA